MKQFYIKYCLHNLWFHLLTLFSVILITISFFTPPQGVIDGSVLAALGELFAFGSLGTVIKAIDKGTGATIRHNSTELEIKNEEDQE